MLSSRISGAIVLWLLLIHVAALLWLDQVHPATDPLLVLSAALLFDAGLAALCERGAALKVEGLQDRVAARVLVVTCSGLATVPAVGAIYTLADGRMEHAAYIVWGVLALVGMVVVYARIIPDLSLLSVAAVAGVAMVTSAFSRVVMHTGWKDVGILVIGVAVLAQVLVVAGWLRQWAHTRRSTP